VERASLGWPSLRGLGSYCGHSQHRHRLDVRRMATSINNTQRIAPVPTQSLPIYFFELSSMCKEGLIPVSYPFPLSYHNKARMHQLELAALHGKLGIPNFFHCLSCVFACISAGSGIYGSSWSMVWVVTFFLSGHIRECAWLSRISIIHLEADLGGCIQLSNFCAWPGYLG
jgi:hypothetical protein